MIKKRQYKLTDKQLLEYETYLREQERAENTIQKYIRDLKNLQAYTEGKVFTKELLLAWKEELLETRSSVSVNSMLAAANSFFTFMGWQELTRTEYASLVREARREGNERLSLLMQTICATGIRVSELQYITVEAVARGRAEINNKGKRRVIFLPQKLQKLLRKYLQKQKITAGAVFVTKSGNPLDRTNIWREMKLLCERAGVEPEKAFSHNLRHLFARTYYGMEKDLVRLADILGHSSVNTTRIYTAESCLDYAKRLERLDLITV